jgi:hypothetical protein
MATMILDKLVVTEEIRWSFRADLHCKIPQVIKFKKPLRITYFNVPEPNHNKGWQSHCFVYKEDGLITEIRCARIKSYNMQWQRSQYGCVGGTIWGESPQRILYWLGMNIINIYLDFRHYPQVLSVRQKILCNQLFER